MLFTALALIAQASEGQPVLVSEVLPASQGQHGWVELYNAGSRTQRLDDWSAIVQDHVLGGARTFRFPEGTAVGPHQHVVLQRSADGLPKLPETGSILLLAGDHRQVWDIFTWPSLPRGVSACRCDGRTTRISYSLAPSPGAVGEAGSCRSQLLPAPMMRMNEKGIVTAGVAGAELRYTTDGSDPTENSPLFVGSYILGDDGIITLRAFAPDAVPSTCTSMCRASPIAERTIALRIAPADLDGAPNGLFLDQRSRKDSKKGRRTDVMVELVTMGDDVQRSEYDRIRIAGSGTRGLPKKSFKLEREMPTHDPVLGPWPEVMLRADASPNAFLHNLFMEEAMKAGAHFDVQPSLPVMMELNGRSIGLYRAMPAKNSDWLLSRCNAEDVDVVDGPAANPVHGSDRSFITLLDALQQGAPIDSLERLMDVTSLLDLACADIWTGRADHDLNMRAWRPRVKGGRWRFILFDMDLWAPPDEHTIDRMCSEPAPVSPWLPWLFDNTATRDALLTRMSAWLATAFSTQEARTLADSLFKANEVMMRADHERWSDTLSMLAPEEAIRSVQEHAARRTSAVLDQLARRTDKTYRTVEVSVAPGGLGWFQVEGLVARSSTLKVPVFQGAPVQVVAHPSPGFEFVEWQGAKVSGSALVLDGGDRRPKAVFRPVGHSSR